MRNKEQDAARHRAWRKENPELAKTQDRLRYWKKKSPNPIKIDDPLPPLRVPREAIPGRKQGDVREDGMVFKCYDKSGSVVREVWTSKEAFQKLKLRASKYRIRAKEKMRLYQKAYYKVPKNRERRNAKQRTPEQRIKKALSVKRLCAKNPAYAIRLCAKARITNVLKAFGLGKKYRTTKYLGCNGEDLVKHLESQFLTGMSWANRKLWHIDHKIPFFMVDVLNERHLMAVCHYSNLRPMWATENLSRKYDDVDLSSLPTN